MSAHLSEWTLRRLHAGELPAAEATQARAHVTDCPACGAVLEELERAQRRFEEEVPFERFAARVERAARQDVPARPSRWERAMRPLMAVAATVLVLVGGVAIVRDGESGVPRNRTKGGAVAELRIGGDGPQRAVRPGTREALQPGERVRLGYEAGTHRYVAAVSVDAAGEVTPLYPESGESLPVEPGAGLHWLPGSLEFTGSGAERVVLVLGDAPLAMGEVVRAAREAFQAGGRDVNALPELAAPGEQAHWVLLKP
ncbi:DUF4384 domain-containing protein [Myxococcaceae bacterium GXIMD 01537]